MSVTGSAWQKDYLETSARRRAARALAEYDNGTSVMRAGLTHADDRLTDGTPRRSNIVQLGATQRLFAKRLELDAPKRGTALCRARGCQYVYISMVATSLKKKT